TNGHHAHLVCSECKRVIDLGDCRLEPILQQFASEHHFSITGHLLELYGLCEECSDAHHLNNEALR
ncbi:MAG: transcriptional repressor, partial [Anaerolineaceae bacterium]|nr:transcriptional repressor [Anaerolineaceae bacterium]